MCVHLIVMYMKGKLDLLPSIKDDHAALQIDVMCVLSVIHLYRKSSKDCARISATFTGK